MEYSTYGRHVMADLWGVDFAVLDDLSFLERHMVEAAEKSQAKVLSVSAEKFDPYGCTILVVLSESHMSIHTYPEKRFAAIDCYTCGYDKDPMPAIENLIQILQPKQTYVKRFIRGMGNIEFLEG